MQSEDLLLLQLLKFPVMAIKFLAKVLSILTYLPNYIILFFIDSILFNQHLNSNLNRYILSWLPKVLLLGAAVALFGGQFYLIFEVMQLSQHGLMIQIIGMILTLAGLLILMRKGYLSMLEKYNLTKLKSPMEHAELGVSYIVDILGIALWIVNVLMVINLHHSWDYEYSSTSKYRFIKHISGLIKESAISYLEFFYIKIFFKLFPWRFVREMATYQKQKEEKNVLNCLVLLTLIYLITCVDILVVAVFGPACVLHFHRRYYYESMKSDHEKYKVTLKEFVFITLQSLQLIIEAVCFIFCWKNGWMAIKLLVGYNITKQLFGKEFKELIIETILKIPYLIATLFISLSIYKLKRRNYLRAAKNNKSKTQQIVPDVQRKDWQVNDNLEITFTCLVELIVDSFYFPLILIGSIIKPWKYWWLRYIINTDYTMERDLIAHFFIKGLLQLLSLPFVLLLSLLFVTYDIKKPIKTYRSSCEQVQKSQQKIDSSAPNPELDDILGKSALLHYIKLSLGSIFFDIPHLPEFFITKMTFLNIYLPNITPQTTPNLFVLLQRTYFQQSVQRSVRAKEYQLMFDRIRASGGMTDKKQQYRFWKFSYKCERLYLIQRIMSFLLPKVSAERIKAKTQKPTQFSQISNLYWHNVRLTKAMIKRFLFLVLETILSILGALFLFPLTLWRIPTFIKLFSYHRQRKFFFPILMKVYHQMLFDVLRLPFKLVALIIAPKMYISFILKTSFNYGPSGLETFGLYQKGKSKYFGYNILLQSLLGIMIHCQVIFILFFWIRIKSLKICLRTFRLTIFSLYTDVILTSPSVPTVEKILAQSEKAYKSYHQKNEINLSVCQTFKEAILDLPYLILVLFIFLTMPWRINYLIQAIQDMRDDTSERKSFFRLLRNIFKDYACIFMNILLLLSGFKTKKALFLIKRNYRLNFFKGFLQYSYYNELKKQIKALCVIYKNIFFLAIAVLFCWTRAPLIVSDLSALRKKQKEEEQSSVANKKIYENTVKSGKQLQTLHKMGYYNYITVCSFLNVSEIITLKKVDKFNYMMTQREEIWFMKWESIYSKTSNQASENFELNCKNAFIAQKNIFVRATYEQIIMNHFYNNVFVEKVDLREFLRGKLPQRHYDKIFKNYEFTFLLGYGPENELPQEENEDEEFLRMTNQVRRPKIELEEEMAWMHLLYFRMTEFLVQKMHRYFRQDRNRRIKQVTILCIIGSVIIFTLLFIFLLRNFIFSIDSLITIKLLLCFYYFTFIFVIVLRCLYLLDNWVSLVPFDIYYDVVNFLKMLRDKFRDYLVTPTVNFAKKCGRFVAKMARKMCQKGKAIGEVIMDKIYIVGGKIKRISIKAKNVTVDMSILFYQKVVKPLYISIADKIRKLFNFIASVCKAIFNSVKSFLLFIGSLFTSFYRAIRAVFSNINKLYYFVLESTMLFLLKFGLLGNLVFTLFGLILMTLPSIICWAFYRERWYIIASTIHTMVLIVVGYKHLNRIRSSQK